MELYDRLNYFLHDVLLEGMAVVRSDLLATVGVMSFRFYLIVNIV